MISIQETVNSFLNILRDKGEGEPFSRFKSWEYCHNIFVQYHQHIVNNELTEDDKDILALHLGFYLASWGMYRGSSFILQRDYKTHKRVVNIVFKEEYNDLWNFDPLGKSDDELKRIAKLANVAYNDIDQNGYRDENGHIPERTILEEDNEEDSTEDESISTTLITKILMGTFAITPAFDRFFIDGLKKYNNANNQKGSSYNEERILKLFIFANNHRNELDTADRITTFPYPIMKKIDMYFWEIGYEFGFIKPLIDLRNYLNQNNAAFICDTKKLKVFNRLISQINVFAPEVQNFSGTHLEIIDNTVSMIEHRIY